MQSNFRSRSSSDTNKPLLFDELGLAWCHSHVAVEPSWEARSLTPPFCQLCSHPH